MRRLFFYLISVLLFLQFFYIRGVYGASYGSGTYGSGVYGSGTSTSGSSSTSSNSPAPCLSQSPGVRASWLFAAVPKDATSIQLYFTPADNPYDHFALEFGLAFGQYRFGLTNIGDKYTGIFLVQNLSPSTTYYFRIQGVNGCAPGPWSNEISAKTLPLIASNNLKIVSSSLSPAKKNPATKCSYYTVQAGDTLFGIAQGELGDEAKYQKIINLNVDSFPSLRDSFNLQAGWKLKISCKTTKTQTPKQKEGFTLDVKLVDTKSKPIVGAKVSLYSVVRQATTNKQGVARFEGVEQGQHKVLISYNNYSGEQSIVLSGKQKEYSLKIVVQPSKFYISSLAWIILSVMSVIIVILLVLLKKKSRP